jgi:hypothetical protein
MRPNAIVETIDYEPGSRSEFTVIHLQ